MEELYRKHQRMLALTPTKIVRQCAQNINWDAQMLAIRGPKGVGKTTMMLQYIKQHYQPQDLSVLYCSLDGAYFTDHNVLDFVDKFYMNGGKHLFLDEVHKYPNWGKEMKEIYDTYPDLQVVLSGSSLLDMMTGDSDLSRRCINHDIQGLSFREYLQFYKDIELPVSPLKELLENPMPLCQQLNTLCRPLAFFREYLQYGYYPYYIKNKIDYYTAVEQVTYKIIDDELPRICGVDVANTRKIKALMNILAAAEPYEVDIQKLSVQTALRRETILGYLNYMQRAKLLNLLYCDNTTIKKLQKPDKIYIENSNLLYTLAQQPLKQGTVRETFAVNQLAYQHKVEYKKANGDFLVDGKYTMEVGGNSKDYTQIAHIPNSYILADDMELPIGHKLPLWIIGFLY